MALTACPECEGRVSSDATACPHCGHPLAQATIGDERTRDSAKLLGIGALVAGGCFIAGSLLPWITVRALFISMSVSGVDGGGDGVITLGAGVLLVSAGAAAMAGIIGRVSPAALWIAAAIAGGVLATSVSDISSRISTVNQDSLGSASYGVGLFVIAAGILAAIFMANSARKAAKAEPGTGES